MNQNPQNPYPQNCVKFNPLFHMVLTPSETGLKKSFIIDYSGYGSLSGCFFIGEFFDDTSIQRFLISDRTAMDNDLLEFVDKYEPVIRNGFYFTGNSAENAMTPQQQMLKNIIDQKFQGHLKVFLFSYVEKCYELFKEKHSYIEQKYLFARLVNDLYQKHDIEWLRRQSDLYSIDILDMFDYDLIFTATSFIKEPELRTYCQSFFKNEHSYDIFDEPWGQSGPFIRWRNFEKIQKILEWLKNLENSTHEYVCLFSDQSDSEYEIRNLAEDVIRFFEYGDSCYDFFPKPILYKNGILYNNSLYIDGITMDLFSSTTINQIGHQPLLIIDESESVMWENIEKTAGMLLDLAKNNELHILWFRGTTSFINLQNIYKI